MWQTRTCAMPDPIRPHPMTVTCLMAKREADVEKARRAIFVAKAMFASARFVVVNKPARSI